MYMLMRHLPCSGLFEAGAETPRAPPHPIVESSATNPVRFEGTEIRVPNASDVLATGGGRATYDDRTRVVYTKVRPVLKTADFLAATPVAFLAFGSSTATTQAR
jgi:hypothetical protein